MFSVSSATITRLAKPDAGIEAMLVYIILARGVSMSSMQRMSAYNASHIVSKIFLEQSKIDTALQWLVTQNVIASGHSADPQDPGVKWLLQDGPQDIYLPALLTDTKGRPPPIMRVHAPEQGLPEIAVDDLVVLLMLYQFQDMEKCGGVDPRSGLYRQWVNTAEGHEGPYQVVNIIGSDAAIFEVSGATALVCDKFAAHALSYVEDEQVRKERLHQALLRLQQAGLMYEVVQVWDSNPNGVDGRHAKPLYTHYVVDPVARDLDPSLQKEIQRVAYRLGVTDSYAEFTEAEYAQALAVKLRYVADKQVGGYPVGVFRLKYRHHSTEKSVDADAESHRANAWLRELQERYLRQP
jgi:hypothetical protein